MPDARGDDVTGFSLPGNPMPMTHQQPSSPTAADRHEVELGERTIDRAGPDHGVIVPELATDGK
jgi:hypothetical protein